MKKRKLFAGITGVLGSLTLVATPAVAHNGDHPFVPGSQAVSGDVIDGKVALESKLTALNGSQSTGNAAVSVEDGKATVRLRTTSASKDMPHAQHIHIGGSNSCPPPAADTNNDGLISVAEGVPFYGGIAVPLTRSGDVSGDSGLAVERFPTGDGNFVVDYKRTFDLPEGVTASDVANGVIVQHGISELFDDNYRYDGSKPSALSSDNQLYVINPTSGAVTPSGAKLTPGIVGDAVGIDFNPTVDRLRVTTNASQDLRVNVDTDAVIVDGGLKYASGDMKFGSGARIVASAYTNNFDGATTTKLFNLDADANSLVEQLPPNEGVLNTVGSLGYDAVDNAGFDISPNGMALAAVSSGGPSQLRSVNLDTGTTSAVGPIGDYRYVKGLAISG